MHNKFKLKRLAILACSLILGFSLTSCKGGKGADLLILSWGEYISDDLISEFERTNNVNIKLVTTDSNESMYTMIQNKTAEYDLAIPSDYMIDQMKTEGMILELDYDKLPSYHEGYFVDELEELMAGEDCINYKGYYMPYFWGSLGIMYSTKKYPELEDLVHEHGWNILFDEKLRPEGAKVAMYNGSRDALAAAELYLGYSLNTSDKNEIDRAMETLKEAGFRQWGTDDLKIEISKGTLDLALVYSGDYFDAYYADMEGGNEKNVENYGIYAPWERNNVFFDGMVIPNTSTAPDLAHMFIDFMISHYGALENAAYVGFCPTVKSVYEEVMADEEGFGDVTSVKAYSPVNILKKEGSIGEVYKFLGSETFKYIERKYTEVLF